MTDLSTLVGYVIVEQRSDGTHRLASADLITDLDDAHVQLAEHIDAEHECNGWSKHFIAEVHEREAAP